MSFCLKNITDATALRLLKVMEFCMYFMLIIPIITLLYQDKGVSVGDFFMIQGLFAFAGFLFEIPSGYLSDRFSRKNVLLSGAILTLIALVVLFLAHGFWQVAFSEMLLGFSSALFSGTKEAYAYDLLKRSGKHKTFLREYGSITTWAQLSGFIAALLGGTLYAVIGNWVVALEALVAAVGVMCVMALPELTEVKRKVAPESSPLKDITGIVKMAIKHPELKWLMLFPALFGAFTLVLMWGLQPTMQASGVAVALFGFFVGINQFARVVSAKFANKTFGLLGLRKTILTLCALVVAAIIAVIMAVNISNMVLVYALCVIIAIVPGTQKMMGLIFNTLVHHRIKSQERGTVLSVSSMYTTVCNGCMMMLMKPLFDGVGLEWTMVILLCMLPILIIPIRQIWKMDIK